MRNPVSIRHHLVVALALVGLTSTVRSQDELLLHLQVPGVPLTTGSEFDSAVLFDSQSDLVQGWSFGVTHDPAVLELLGAQSSETTNTANNGSKPDFLVLNTNPSPGPGVSMAVVLSFVSPVYLPAGEDYELLTMQYRVVADPTLEDPCAPVESSIDFTSSLGTPPVTTVITVDGSSETPALESGAITVRCPGTLEITRCEGDTENVYLEWTLGGVPEWDFLFLYRDGDFLAPLDVDQTSYTDEGLEPGDYRYTIVTFIVADPTNPSLIFAFCTATVIPVTITSIEPTIGNWLGNTEVTVLGTAFTSLETTQLSFFDGDETLSLEILEIVSESELRALTPVSPRLGLYSLRLENERGSTELSNAFEYGFVRGDSNSDADIDISDAIFTLNFLFLGADAPVCEDATDATDDGMIDLSDGVRIVDFLFSGGRPPPPPYPGPGRDPTPDELGCLD